DDSTDDVAVGVDDGCLVRDRPGAGLGRGGGIWFDDQTDGCASTAAVRVDPRGIHLLDERITAFEVRVVKESEKGCLLLREQWSRKLGASVEHPSDLFGGQACRYGCGSHLRATISQLSCGRVQQGLDSRMRQVEAMAVRVHREKDKSAWASELSREKPVRDKDNSVVAET